MAPFSLWGQRLNNCRIYRRIALPGVLTELNAGKSLKKASSRADEESAHTEAESSSRDENNLPRVLVEDGQQYIKTTLLSDLDLITGEFVKKAKAGGTAQFKLLWQLGKLDEDATAKPKQNAPSLSSLLLRELRMKQAAKKNASSK